MRIALLTPASVKEFRPMLDIEEDQELPTGLICAMMTGLVKEFLLMGHEVILCTLDEEIKKPMIFYGPGLTLFVGRYGKYGKVRAATFFAMEVHDIVTFLKGQPECDVYNAHWTYEFSLAAHYVAPNKTLITIRDWPATIFSMKKDYYRFIRLMMAKKVFRMCEYFTCNSIHIEQLMRQAYPQKNIITITNCIDCSKKYIEDKNLNVMAPRIIAVNNGFSGWKNVKKIIQAYQLIRKEIPAAQLHMFGSEHEPGGVAESWAIEHGMNLGIFYHGKITGTQIIEEMRKADLLIHAGLEESFGMVFVEAMLSKTPTIGGKDSGAVPWVLDNGNAGILVDVTSERDISDNAIQILKDSHRWKSIVKKGYDYAIKMFSVEYVAKNYIESYHWRLNSESTSHFE